jgi:hypothetical protein
MSEVLPRINGTEMEWAYVVPQAKKSAASRQLEAKDLQPHLTSYFDTHAHLGSPGSCFLDNGARFYIDIGDHPEYATPEDNSYKGTCANEIAGEQILHNIAQTFTHQFPVYSLNKRVLGDDGLTWGYHESYSVDANRIDINYESLALHGVYLATRNIFFGGGAVLMSGNYVLGQKANGLTYEFSSGTTRGDKPVVNLRDEALSNSALFRRVHVTSGDPNMSPWATRMKLGTTSLVLRLIEHGETLGRVRLESLLSAAKQINHDTSLAGPIPLENGRTRTAVEVQQLLCKAATYLSQHVELPEEDMWTLSEWQHACRDASQNPALLYDRADWVLKKQLLDRQHQKAGIEWASEKMRILDRRYSEIGPDTSSAQLRKGLWQKWMPATATINHRVNNPPPHTRAAIRGKVVAAFFKSETEASVQWQSMTIKSERIDLPDPHVYSHDRVDALVKTAA